MQLWTLMCMTLMYGCNMLTSMAGKTYYMNTVTSDAVKHFIIDTIAINDNIRTLYTSQNYAWQLILLKVVCILCSRQ